MKRIFIAATLAITLIFSAVSTHALTKGFEVLMLRPATDGGRYFGVWDSSNLEQLQWELGTLITYANRPMQLTNNGRRVQGIVDDSITQHFYTQVGLIDQWLSIGLDAPVGWWVKWQDPNLAGSTMQNKFAIGDVNLHFKSEFLPIDKYKVGIAFLPFVTIPTGYGRYFYGNGTVTGGGKFIFEFEPFDIWTISLNAGVQMRKTFNFRNIEKGHQILLGLGTAVQVHKNVSIAAEVDSMTRLTGPFKEKVETPVEARGGVKWNVGDSGFQVSLGGGAGIISGSGAPRFRAFGGLSFSPRRRIKREPEPMVIDLSAIENAKVHFNTASTEIVHLNEAVQLGHAADIIRENETVRVKVKGNTDNRGSDEYNAQLSEARAEKVKWYIGMHGVDESRLMVEAFGDSDPVGDNDTREGRAENRRVDFNATQ